MNKSTLNKGFLLLILSLIISCDSKMKGTWKCNGGMVDGLEFLAGDQVIFSLMSAKVTSTYLLNNNIINIKTDKGDLVFKVTGEELKGEKYFGYGRWEL